MPTLGVSGTFSKLQLLASFWETSQPTQHAILVYLDAQLSLGTMPYLPAPKARSQETALILLQCYSNLAAWCPDSGGPALEAGRALWQGTGKRQGGEWIIQHRHLSLPVWVQILMLPNINTMSSAGHLIFLSLNFFFFFLSQMEETVSISKAHWRLSEVLYISYTLRLIPGTQ